MRHALGELDQNTQIAIRRSSRQCELRVRDETPVRTRDAGANTGRRRWRGRHSGERLETECGGAGGVGGARARKLAGESF